MQATRGLRSNQLGGPNLMQNRDFQLGCLHALNPPAATLSLQRCYLPRRKIFVKLIPPHFLEAVAIIATALHDDSVSAQMLPTMDARLGNDLYGWPWRCRRCRRRGRHRQRTRIPEAALLIERPNLPFRIDVAGPTWNRRAARPPLPENFSVVIDVGAGKRLT